jgi:hypothetical protein
VFLDIPMPRPSHFDVLAAVGANRRFAPMFVTAYEGYAIVALDVQAPEHMRNRSTIGGSSARSTAPRAGSARDGWIRRRFSGLRPAVWRGAGR